jgi:hypothetical protein
MNTGLTLRMNATNNLNLWALNKIKLSEDSNFSEKFPGKKHFCCTKLQFAWLLPVLRFRYINILNS